MRNFNEYMNSKGTIESPTVKVVADKVDCPEGRKYAPEQKGTGKALAYSNGKSVKQSKEPGFGEKGLSNLKYTPGESKKAAKIPTAEHYDLFQAVRQVIGDNPTFMEQLVREFKRNGLLGILVGELVEHKETFSHLAGVMASEAYGPTICNKLARAIREDIAPPFSQSAHGHNMTGVGDDDMGDDSEFGDDEFGDGDDMGHDDHDDMDHDDNDMGHDEFADDDDDDMGHDDAGDGSDQMGPDGQPMPQLGPDGQPLPPQMGPDGQPLPPQQGMPPMMPGQGMPPAMENLFAAFKLLRS